MEIPTWLIDLSMDRWIGVSGLFLALLGIWLTWRAYRTTLRPKVLAISYSQPLPLLLPLEDLITTFEGKQITALRRVFVLLLNKGSSPIERSDFIRPIALRNAEKVLRLKIFDKDPAADIDLDRETNSIAPNLLRPGEAVILQIDSTDNSYRPDVDIEMKTSDMSRTITAERVFLPHILGALVGFYVAARLLSSEFLIIKTIEYGRRVGFDLGLLSAFAYIATGLLVGFIVFIIFRRLANRKLSPVAARFMRLQTKLYTAKQDWQNLRDKFERVSAA